MQHSQHHSSVTLTQHSSQRGEALLRLDDSSACIACAGTPRSESGPNTQETATAAISTPCVHSYGASRIHFHQLYDRTAVDAPCCECHLHCRAAAPRQSSAGAPARRMHAAALGDGTVRGTVARTMAEAGCCVRAQRIGRAACAAGADARDCGRPAAKSTRTDLTRRQRVAAAARELGPPPGRRLLNFCIWSMMMNWTASPRTGITYRVSAVRASQLRPGVPGPRDGEPGLNLRGHGKRAGTHRG